MSEALAAITGADFGADAARRRQWVANPGQPGRQNLTAECCTGEPLGVEPTGSGNLSGFRLSLPDGPPSKGGHLPDPVDATTTRMVMIYTECGPADPKYYEAVLRKNMSLPAGALALRDMDDQPNFVMVDAMRVATVTPSGLAKRIENRSRHADLVKNRDQERPPLRSEDVNCRLAGVNSKLNSHYPATILYPLIPWPNLASTSTTWPPCGRPGGRTSPTRSGRRRWPSWAGPTASRCTCARTAATSQDRDLRLLRETVTVKLNLELACDAESLAIACQVQPDQATLVPERREEVTTEGGLDVVGQRDAGRRRSIERLHEAGICVSLFLDPDPAADRGRPPSWAPSAVELHTGQYALARPAPPARSELDKLRKPRPLVRQSGHGAARRPRADLPQRPAGRRHRGHARAEHRPQHRRAGHHGRLGARPCAK